MPMFIQPTSDINETNRHLHIENIELANSLAYQFNKNIMARPSSFIYCGVSKKVELHKEFDIYPEYSKIIALMINWILLFEKEYDDKDLYLVPFLYRIKDFIIFNSNYDDKTKEYLLKNLDLSDHFGKISSDFLKEKINELLEL